MERGNKNLVFMQLKKYFGDERSFQINDIIETLSEEEIYNITALPYKDPIITLVLSIFLGGIGVDRFYLGDIGLGIAKLLLGWLTLGLWPLVDIYFSYQRSKEVNFRMLAEYVRF